MTPDQPGHLSAGLLQGQSHLPASTLSACHSAAKDNLVPSLSRSRLSVSPNSCPATAFCSLSPAILASESWKAQSSVASGPLHWLFLLPALLPSGLLGPLLCILQVSSLRVISSEKLFFNLVEICLSCCNFLQLPVLLLLSTYHSLHVYIYLCIFLLHAFQAIPPSPEMGWVPSTVLGTHKAHIHYLLSESLLFPFYRWEHWGLGRNETSPNDTTILKKLLIAIIWYHLYVEFKKNDTNELLYKTETLTDIEEDKLMVTKGEREGGGVN